MAFFFFFPFIGWVYTISTISSLKLIQIIVYFLTHRVKRIQISLDFRQVSKCLLVCIFPTDICLHYVTAHINAVVSVKWPVKIFKMHYLSLSLFDKSMCDLWIQFFKNITNIINNVIWNKLREDWCRTNLKSSSTRNNLSIIPCQQSFNWRFRHRPPIDLWFLVYICVVYTCQQS